MSESEEFGPFHQVGNIFPGETSVETVEPGTPALRALRIMLERGYSQLPVLDEERVLGVFSLWTFARSVGTTPELNLRKLEVQDAMEQVPNVTVMDGIDHVRSALERSEAVLVTSPHGLQAIATAWDLFDYFYRVARPFILLQEIEMSLRDLIHRSAPGGKLAKCIEVSIAQKYEAQAKETPTRLQDMSFEDHIMIIVSHSNWPLFQGVLGANRELFKIKLQQIREIRNKVFHFREDISVLEYATLAWTRDWLFGKMEVSR